jgi:hypothetical protein
MRGRIISNPAQRRAVSERDRGGLAVCFYILNIFPQIFVQYFVRKKFCEIDKFIFIIGNLFKLLFLPSSYYHLKALQQNEI